MVLKKTVFAINFSVVKFSSWLIKFQISILQVEKYLPNLNLNPWVLNYAQLFLYVSNDFGMDIYFYFA